MTKEQITCLKIQEHVGVCSKCSKALSFDPVEKSLLKSYSIKNDVLELCTFIVTGVIIIIMLHFVVELKMKNNSHV